MSELQMKVPPSDLYLSIRGIQYAFHEALADLVDNCIDANAARIWIKADKGEIIIADDGDGMGRDDLETAITPWRAGSTKAHLRKGKRGKFGIGMKSASFSLGDCLEVHTKADGSKFEYIELDKDKVAKIKDPDHKFKTENTTTELFKSFCKDGHGTVLKITRVNKRKVIDQALESLKNLLGLVYYQLIENGELKIIINNSDVKPLDPLMRGLKKNSPKNKYELFEKKTITVEHDGKKAIFKVQGAYVGRGAFWADDDKKSFKYFLKRNPDETEAATRGLLKLDEQGIYTLRNGRLITLGGWLGLASKNTLLHHNGSTRVLLEFDEAGDDFMGLDTNKTQLKVEELLKEKVGAYIREIVGRGEDAYRAEGDIIKRANMRKSSSGNVKNLNLSKDSAIAQYNLEQRRKKAIPEYDDKQKNIAAEDRSEAQKSEELVILKEKMAYGNLWGFEKNKNGEVILFINEQHPGYAALFLEDDDDKFRKNLIHLFYTLALHEASINELHSELKPAVLKELEDAFGTFRRWVSKHYTEF
ncbi:MAG: ATP-binding protein [Pseudomonadota bacterium]|nr:ATP-binding protein [Pseudomonadota bacterium]